MFDLRTLRAADSTLALLTADPASVQVACIPRRVETAQPAPARGCPRHAMQEEAAA